MSIIEPSVICYFPGSGGNRLARYLLNKPWNKKPGQAAHGDIPVPEINYSDRDTRPYPTKTTHIIQRSSLIELTHCMNSELVRELFPNRKIIKIKYPLYQCLPRYWTVHGYKLHEALVRKMSPVHGYNREIEWHWQYYTNTGVDWSADQLWDLSQDHEFCNWMRQEIADYSSQDFQRAIHVYQTLKRRSLYFGQ